MTGFSPILTCFHARYPFLVTFPHSGELIPAEAPDELKARSARVLLTDVDRFVDQLYLPSLEAHQVAFVLTQCHRYVVDLNRTPKDLSSEILQKYNVDTLSLFSTNQRSEKKFVSGFHWSKTTQGDKLLDAPLSLERHDLLRRICYEPFHRAVEEMDRELMKIHGIRFHIDAHSMPSVATAAHSDSGRRRPDFVVSDCEGRSCDPGFRIYVVSLLRSMGFSVGVNDPYKGGRLTEIYGQPELGRHSLQIEINRSLYMNEKTREPSENFLKFQKAITQLMGALVSWTHVWKKGS